MTKQLETLNLKERTSNALTKSNRVTKEGVMKGVNIIGLIGKANKAPGATEPYVYKESAIKGAVTNKVYDSRDSFLGHSPDNGQRTSPKDRIGVVVADSVVFKEGVGAVGDIQLDPKHPYFSSIEWWANNYPEKIMLSHEAKLVYSKNENAIVEITSVESVDFVLDGNTTTALFKEGVIRDEINEDDTENALSRIMTAFHCLCSTVMYPMNQYNSSGQSNALTPQEKAVLLTPIAQDLVKELKALSATTKEAKEQDMDLKLLTIEELTKGRPDLVATIGTEAVAKETALNDKVSEAVKVVPADKRSSVFLKLVKEAVAKNDTALVTELVSDRAAIVKESVVSTVVTPETSEQILAREATSKGQEVVIKDEDILAKINAN
jgi:hypothetical protein